VVLPWGHKEAKGVGLLCRFIFAEISLPGIVILVNTNEGEYLLVAE
jgi:hypothetical protein